MKRYELKAYLTHPSSLKTRAIATYVEKSNGRFVMYEDVEDIIEKAKYWETQFRQELKRVSELCEKRDTVRRSLKKVQEDCL